MNMNDKMKIFVSYGHDEYTSFAFKLVDYLREKGFDVWIDVRDIHESSFWDEEIERGLMDVSAAGERGKFVLIMTPKSIGRPGGFCLNEIAMALDKKINILPLMLKQATPPIFIYRIQYLDCQNCMIGNTLNEDLCKSVFERIERNIQEYSLDTSGSYSSLRAHLSPIDFSSDINHFQRSFVGRSWLDSIVDDWLQNGNERCLFIKGKPGSGKTAISTHLLSVLPNIVAYHICRRNNCEKSNPKRAVCTIAYQISTQIPEYSERLLAILTERNIDSWDSRTLFEELIVTPLSSVRHDDNKDRVILIDALDESSVSGGESIVTFLSSLSPLLPDWVRLIVTSRPLNDIVCQFNVSTRFVNLDSVDYVGLNKMDMLSYIDKTLEKFMGEVCFDTAKRRIVDNASGVFLYVKTICENIISGEMDISDHESFPKSISSIYNNFFRTKFTNIGLYNSRHRVLLSLMVASFDPLTKDMVCRLMKIRKHELESLLLDLGGFIVVGSNNELQFFHLTMMEWLVDDSASGCFAIDRKDGDEIFIGYGIDDNVLSEYLVRHLPKHLALVGDKDRLLELFNDSEYVEALEGCFANRYEVIDILFDNFRYYYDNFCSRGRKRNLESFYLCHSVMEVFRNYSFFLFDKEYYRRFGEMGFDDFIRNSDFKSLPEILRVRTISFYYTYGLIGDVLKLDFSDIEDEDLDMISDDRKKYMAGFYNMLGVANRICGNMELAEKYISRSADYYLRNGNLDSGHVVAANLSRVFKYNLEFDKAENILRPGMEYALSFGFPDTYNDEYERILHLHNGPTFILAEYAIDVYNMELAKQCIGVIARFFEKPEARRGSRFYPRYLYTMVYLSLMEGDWESAAWYRDKCHEIAPSAESYYQVDAAACWYRYFADGCNDLSLIEESVGHVLKSMKGCVKGRRWESYAYVYPLYALCCEILGTKPELDANFPLEVFKKWIDYRKGFYLKLVDRFKTL